MCAVQVKNEKLACIKHNRILKAVGRARFALSGRFMPCVAHLMLVMLRLTPFVAHLMLVMVLNRPEQCSFQDLLFHLLFMPKYAKKSASRMDISLTIIDITVFKRRI